MGWEPEWIAATKDIIRAEFDNSYAQPEDIEEGEDGDGDEKDTEASVCKDGNFSNIFDKTTDQLTNGQRRIKTFHH